MSTQTATRVSRSVVQSVLSRETPEGAGAVVRRSIGTAALRNFTPFLMLDHFNVAPGAGFPDHPHRGMTTLTYMLTGEFQHEDFKGHKGNIGPGDLQFMIAGKGIMHAEMPIHRPGGDNPTGLQLWIDLPSAHKLTEASYQELKASEIPSAHPSPDVLVKVICGTAQGNEQEGMVSSPVRPLGGCWFFDVKFAKAGERFWQEIPKGWNAFTYILEGSVSHGSEGSALPIKTFHTSVLSSAEGETGIELISTSEQARIVVVAGEPLEQEIVQHGPFVMDSRAGIQRAFQDYQMGANGFEGAHEWRSEIGKRMM
ncbi:RmlC-like cupin domain-containing protein [Leucosporidium creatinivorum]|uniref:RmlC-like cupin domain-containing protein n=1 Tax=Leucosporidium creatinivorum TaxID=106004 RepID=A0A1Y2F1P7_9BASI|nr:RmlC-like cupin domain-containing protein [Leucosporidium creatinivorum]